MLSILDYLSRHDKDVIPADYSFTDILDASTVSTAYVSNAIIVSDLSNTAVLPITAIGGHVSINGGLWVTSGTVRLGDSVRSKVISAPVADQTTTVTVNIGNRINTFSVTTSAADWILTTPYRFPIETVVESNIVISNGGRSIECVEEGEGAYSLGAPLSVTASDQTYYMEGDSSVSGLYELAFVFINPVTGVDNVVSFTMAEATTRYGFAIRIKTFNGSNLVQPFYFNANGDFVYYGEAVQYSGTVYPALRRALPSGSSGIGTIYLRSAEMTRLPTSGVLTVA